MNDNLVLICGVSGAGKSASLRNIKKPEGVMYLGCEAGKKLPFKTAFQVFTITDPYEVYSGFDHAETKPEIHTIAIDTISFLMEMFESIHVLSSTDTMRGWQNYQQYFKNLMQQYVAKSTKNVIFTGHIHEVLNESAMVMESMVPVKGALKKNGLEAYFSTVVTACKMSLKQLEGYQSKLLNISEEEMLLGFKHVFQTKVTKETINSRIRSPMGMFTKEETYIDNDVKLLMERLHTYYS